MLEVIVRGRRNEGSKGAKQKEHKTGGIRLLAF